MKTELNYKYSKKEEKLNIITHAFGLILSITAFPFLLMKSFDYEGFSKSLSLLVYGFSLIILYAASTFYHAANEPNLRRKLNILDHAAIYVLIAGSYTPFTIIVLKGTLGWFILGFTWSFAIAGIVMKLFFTGRFEKLSTILYVLMGWQIIFAMKPLSNNLSNEGVELLFYGGLFYTIGALFYSLKKIQYNHAIFHVFVVLGSFCHFLTVYFYL